MSILIKGMEMPTSCARCRCARGCPAINDRVVRMDEHPLFPHDHRHEDCPLVPVPPHGRLIDADALTVKLQRHREYHSDGSNSGAAISNGIGQCLDIINGRECPTIIPADPAEEAE